VSDAGVVEHARENAQLVEGGREHDRRRRWRCIERARQLRRVAGRMNDHRRLHASREVAPHDHVVTGARVAEERDRPSYLRWAGATSSVAASYLRGGVAGTTRAGVNAWTAD
jgi:hypothetical protein